jgi:DNA-binding PadR family transcriptional regulator
MVLQTLDTLGPLHGYAIAARLEEASGGAGLLVSCWFFVIF